MVERLSGVQENESFSLEEKKMELVASLLDIKHYRDETWGLLVGFNSNNCFQKWCETTCMLKK